MDNYRIQQRCPLGSSPYIIKSGDTLFNLASRYGTTVEAILTINPGLDPESLQVGRIICIPTVAPPVPPCPGGFYYTIRAGDTFFRIANQFNITVDALRRANPGVDPNRLQIGQVICIPVSAPPTPSCPGGFLYEIRSGDTLFLIAQRHNLSVQELIAANPGIDPNRLRVGQRICIPSS